MGRSNKSPLTSATDLDPNGDMSDNSCSLHGSAFGDMAVIVTSTTGKPSCLIQAAVGDQLTPRGDPVLSHPDCSRLDPREKETLKKSKKKGRKRKKREKNTAEEANVCAATVAGEYQNTWPNTCDKNCPKVIITDANGVETTEQMIEVTPPPEASAGNHMPSRKKGKKRRKKSFKGLSHETSRCGQESDVPQQTPGDNIPPHHEGHENSCETSASQGVSSSTGASSDTMHLNQSPEQNRIKTKLEANAAGLEELHLLKQSQLAKVQEALAMVKQRCRHPELTTSHLSPPISPSRLGLKSPFSWSHDISSGSTSSLYNEPISEVDEDLMRPRAATFSQVGGIKDKMDDVRTSPRMSPVCCSTPLRKQFTQPRSLNGTKLTYNFPSPMHAVLLQYESLSSMDGKLEEKDDENPNKLPQETRSHHSIVQRRDIHGKDHQVVQTDVSQDKKKLPKRKSDTGPLDMRHILKELSQQDLNTPIADISNVAYPFKKLTRSASLGAYDKKPEQRTNFARSNSFRKSRSKSNTAKRQLIQDKENDCQPKNISPEGQKQSDSLKSTSKDAVRGPFPLTRIRSYSMCEKQSPVAKRMVLQKENSVSCSEIDKSPDPNKSAMPQKPAFNDSSDDEDTERSLSTKDHKRAEIYHSAEVINKETRVPLFTHISISSEKASPAKNKTMTKVMSMMTKLRSHGSLEQLFQRRGRNSLSKIDLSMDEGTSPEWDFPTRHRSVSDLNPRLRYSTVIFPDMTVISMPERSRSVSDNISSECKHSLNSSKSSGRDAKIFHCDTPVAASHTHSNVRGRSFPKQNYLKLKRKSCQPVAQAAC